ncbi:hypothetical protein VTO73DRAFT_13766 [Trametes versicolor]
MYCADADHWPPLVVHSLTRRPGPLNCIYHLASSLASLAGSFLPVSSLSFSPCRCAPAVSILQTMAKGPCVGARPHAHAVAHGLLHDSPRRFAHLARLDGRECARRAPFPSRSLALGPGRRSPNPNPTKTENGTLVNTCTLPGSITMDPDRPLSPTLTSTSSRSSVPQ